MTTEILVTEYNLGKEGFQPYVLVFYVPDDNVYYNILSNKQDVYDMKTLVDVRVKNHVNKKLKPKKVVHSVKIRDTSFDGVLRELGKTYRFSCFYTPRATRFRDPSYATEDEL